MSDPADTKPQEPTITVAGVTFSADQVVSAVLKIDGREIHIMKPMPPVPQIGFNPTT